MRAPEFWQRSDSPVARLLWPASLGWTWAGRLRRLLAKPYVADVPVICIGNVLAGGAGKTPTALAVARWLAGQARLVHLLSRGYGGRTTGPHRVDPAKDSAVDVGDEPLLLAARFPTWIARNRAAGARAAVADGAEAIVMDDGFQNPGLAKSLSLLVVDGGAGIGNGFVIPAGPMREPLADALARADAIVMIGEDQTGLRARLPADKPVLAARIVPGAGARLFRGERVAAFAGIGRPSKFYDTLRGLGARIVATRDFPDHYRYQPEDVMGMVEHAAKRDAVLVTTAKDAVRLPPGALNMVHVLPIELEWAEPDSLAGVLGRVLKDQPRGA